MPAPGWPCVVSLPGRTGSQSSGTVSLGIRLSDLKQFERGKNSNKIRGGGGICKRCLGSGIAWFVFKANSPQ